MNSAIRINSKEQRDLISILLGMIVGGLAGIGMMILFAPQSGEKTRTQIRDISEELKDRAADTFGELAALSQFDNRKILVGISEKPENIRL
jgi:gas vesicle protein